MKSGKLMFAALGLGALIAFKQPSFADDATTTAPPAADTTAPAAAPAPAPRQRGGRVHAFDRLAETLGLTDDQKTKIRPLFYGESKQMRDVRNDTTLTPDQKKDKAKTIQDNVNQQINAILTPDQQTKYQAFLDARKAHRQEARANADANANPAPAAPAAPANP